MQYSWPREKVQKTDMQYNVLFLLEIVQKTDMQYNGQESFVLFLLDMQYNDQEKKYKRRTCNTMSKRKSTKDGHAIQWPCTKDVMLLLLAKIEKVRLLYMQYNGPRAKSTKDFFS